MHSVTCTHLMSAVVLTVSCIPSFASLARKSGTLNQPGKSSRAVSHSFLSSSSSCEPKPINQRFSLNQITTLRATFEEDLSNLAKSSLASIGLWTNKLADLDPSQVAAQLACSDLTVSSLSFIGGFTGSMGLTFREAMEDAYEKLFLAAAVKARCVVIASGSRGKYTAKHERKLVCQAIHELAMTAEELDIQLAVLPMRSEFARPWTDLHSFDDALNVVGQVDHRRVGVAFDSFHLLDEAMLKRIPKIAASVAHIQVSDRPAHVLNEYSRLAPGEGVLPLLEMVRAFEQAHYAGFYDIQVWSNDVWKLSPAEVIQRCEEWVRSASADEVVVADTVVV